MVGRHEVYEAADEIRAEGGLVAQPSVRARLKRKTGRGGSLRDIGPYLLEWKAERTYAPTLERGGVPGAVSTVLAKATAALWEAARVEADRAYQADRERLEATLADERALRAEALAMADGLVGQVEALTAAASGLRAQVAHLEAELTGERRHLKAVRADEFWNRVVHDMHAILPEDGSMRVSQIADRLGADLVEEARSHAEEWSIKTLRKKMEQRIHHKRLFARSGPSLYRRRRPEDDLPGDVASVRDEGEARK
ncbi:DNA-binding protein [Methylobacterium sp. XJLW]|uniref:DNA-binding protein n=1 Tax=Methylobacterium sp. XJLW TaxID=739141 RepID=UPI0013E06E07|nr:DNA-binding protein [Methylobacterium sp. XJLW]